MKLTEKQKNCQLHNKPFTGQPLEEVVTGEGTALRIEEAAKNEWILKIDYPDDAGNLSGLTESVDIVACPFCGTPLNEEEDWCYYLQERIESKSYASKEFKQSKLYLFRLYLRKIGLIPLLITLYVAIWIVLAIFK